MMLKLVSLLYKAILAMSLTLETIGVPLQRIMHAFKALSALYQFQKVLGSNPIAVSNEICNGWLLNYFQFPWIIKLHLLLGISTCFLHNLLR